MKKINLIVLLALAASLLWSGPTGAQEAQVPFNTVNPANPNVLVFMDQSGNLNANMPLTGGGSAKTWEVVTWVMAGKQQPILTTAGYPVYQPHYDFTSKGLYWVFDRVTYNSSTTATTVERNYYEDLFMPRVVRLEYDGAGYYYPDPGGSYMVFVHLNDATRVTTLLAGTYAPTVTNIAQFFRTAQPTGSDLNGSLRWANNYLVRDTVSGQINFNSDNVSDNSTNRIIWHAASAATGTEGTDYLTYENAMKRYYDYETSGAEAGGNDNRTIVPLKLIPANLGASWVSPSDGGTKSGLCYIDRHKGPPDDKFHDYAYACYKPTTASDPLATRFLVLSETAYGTAAQELNSHQYTLTAYRTARLLVGDTLNGNAGYYCQAEDFEVWGDAPWAQWSFNSGKQPLKDSAGTAPVPIYGGTIGGPTTRCALGSRGSFSYAAAPPTDARIIGEIDASLFRVLGVDVSVPHGSTVDEFILPSGTTRIDNYLRTSLGNSGDHTWWCTYLELFQPGYSCPALPSWPGSISLADPWYGGFFDLLYWDRSDRGSPGIMQSFRNVNWGFAGYVPVNVNNSACPGVDSAADSDDNCNGMDVIHNVSVWGEFPANSAYYPVSVLNESIRQTLLANTGDNGGNSAIASSLHAMWRYFYDVDTTYLAHSAATVPPGDISQTLDLGTESDTMFFDMGFPAAWGVKRHLIQCDPFYKNGCRRNYIIYLVGGRDRSGERFYDAPGEVWKNKFFPTDAPIPIKKDGVAAPGSPLNLASFTGSKPDIYAAQGKWIFALKDPDFINAYGLTDDFTGHNPQPASTKDQSAGPYCRHVNNTDRIPYGVKTFILGFPGNAGDAEQLAFMAWATRMATVDDDPDEIDYWMSSANEDQVRAQLTTVMNAIMAGQFARAAPEISQLEGSIITAFFIVGGGYPLYQGHLLKWSIAQIQSGNTAEIGAEWDFATLLKNQALHGTRNIWTMVDDGNPSTPLERFTFWDHPSPASNSDIVNAMDPNNLWWGTVAATIETEAAGLISLINGNNANATTGGKKIKNWLGPVYHSKPLIVGPPNTLTYLSFPDYATFVQTHIDRPSLIYVGTGHGMLEAISLEDNTDLGLTSGQEVYAYVPTGMLQWLPMLRRGNQPFGVDGSPVVRDAIFYPPITDADGVEHMDWRTVLIVGLAGGGTSYSILDITGVTNDGGDATLLANFSDDNLANTYSVPVIGPVTTKDTAGDVYTKWAAFFGGGLQEDQNMLMPNIGNAFYIVNLQDGTTFAEFMVPDISQVTALRGDTTHPSGWAYDISLGVNKNQVAGTPLLVDKDLDRDYDYAFFGDMEGRIWKAYFSGTLWAGHASPWRICPFYDMADINFNGLIDAGEALSMNQRMPIYYTPDAARTPTNQLLVFFSTGNAEWAKAGDDEIHNKIYALIDPETTGCDYSEPLPATVNGDTVAWPVTLEGGEKPLTPIHIIGGKAIFKTFLPTVTIACSPGTTRLWTLNYLTGTPYYPDTPYVETTPEGGAIGTTDISFDIGIGGGSNSEGIPETFKIPVLPADPLSWGEGIVFD